MQSAPIFQKSSTGNTYREVHFDQVVPVYIPSHLLDKIKYLCIKISRVEWSGVLFYRTSGKFGSKHFRCILEDILPMDMGDTGYTEFTFTEGITPYLQKNQHLRGAILGQIHSHHNMDVFFSPEDTDELHVNAENHNYYLSVIVNNHGDIIAKLCFLATRKHHVSTTLELLGDGGQPMTITTETIKEDDQVLGIYNCEIHYYNSGVNTQFEDRCREVMGKSKAIPIPLKPILDKFPKSNPKQGVIFSSSTPTKKPAGTKSKAPAKKKPAGRSKKKTN